MSRKRRTSLKKKLNQEEIKKKAESNMSKLHPMLYSFLAMQIKTNPKNDFIVSSFDVINKNPERLTEKWINSLNRWAEDLSQKMMLEKPEIKEGERIPFLLNIVRVKPSSKWIEIPSPEMLKHSHVDYYKIFCSDKNGWQYFFSSSKYEFYDIYQALEAKTDLTKSKEEFKVSFSARVSRHVEGMTFLSRPTKIKFL